MAQGRGVVQWTFHGHGAIVWTNGTHYEGEGSGIKRHGHGITTYPSLDARYDGEYRGDLPKAPAR